MGWSLPSRRRTPPPRHSFPPGLPRPGRQRRGDGTTIGVIVVLVLTSGFVAGTTATFTGTTTNAGNTFQNATLTGPSGLTVTPSGANLNLAWTDASGYDNASVGYRISVKDWDPADPNDNPVWTFPPPGTCGSSSAWLTGTTPTYWNAATSSWPDTTTGTTPHPATFTDGRVWCYKVESIYPYPDHATNNPRPWVSLISNPTYVVVDGYTLIGATMNTVTNGFGDGKLSAGTGATSDDIFEFTLNQAMDATKWPTGYLCTNASNNRIYIGLSSATTDVTATGCPDTNGAAPNPNDAAGIRGFYLCGTGTNSCSTGVSGGTGVVGATARFNIGTISSVGCPNGSPAGCYRLRIKIGARVSGSDPTITGTWTAWGTSNTGFINSATGPRNFCSGGTNTSTVSASFQYKKSPTNGNCSIPGIAVGF